ncbi:MAG TPA: polyphenol oxidase family protein [Rubrobacteraceae bacterium]|nr:polyphenol oxidase family protein [Rubrobacteraceae bacterium]
MQTVLWKEHAVGEAGGATYVTPLPRLKDADIWFFTRKGGVSVPPYDSLNVSTLVGDASEAVTENLSRIQTVMGERSPAWVRQVAGDSVVAVERPGLAGEGDALVTGESSFALAVAVADCVPVALVGEGIVGMVHSGWRGTLSGISARAASGMGREVRAYIGPGIRRCCYEISEELAERFAGRFGEEVVSGRYLSLPGAIRRNLEEAGVSEVYDLELCTACRTDLFYSHRKEGPKTGRNLAAMALN